MSGRRSKAKKKKKSPLMIRKLAEKLPTLGIIGLIVSIVAFLFPLNPRVSISPLAPLDESNVFPKFMLANTGAVSLDEVSTECIVNGSGLKNVVIRNARISPANGPMMFHNIPPGAYVSTSCGIRGAQFAPGTMLDVRTRYKVPVLRFRRSNDSYFRLVYDSEGRPRWDPDAGPSAAL